MVICELAVKRWKDIWVWCGSWKRLRLTMSKCFLRFIQEFSILGLNHPWLTLCSYRALYRVIYIVFILLTFLCTQRIKSDLRGPREIWTALILWKVNLRAAKSWFDSPSSEKVKVSPSNFLAAVFSSKMFFSLSA